MSRNFITLMAPLTQSSGVEVNVNLVMDKKPARQEQKLKTLTQYVQQYPSGWKKRLELAELLYEMGNWTQAVEEYGQLLERQGHRIDLWLKLAKLVQLMGKVENAIAIYENALSLTKNLATRDHINGLIALCKDDTQGAITAFQSATTVEPENAAHWLALGQVQMKIEDINSALQAFNAILLLDPDDLMALIYSYDALIATGNVVEAQQKLNRATELAPDDYQVLKRLAHSRCRLKLVSGEEGKQTKQMISSLLRLAPDATDVHAMLANYYSLRGEKKKGVEVLQQFTQRHPNNPSGWYYYAQGLLDAGESQKAAEAISKAYNLYPKDKQIYRTLCEILLVEGK